MPIPATSTTLPGFEPGWSDTGSDVSVIPPFATQTLIEVSKDATIGAQYRLSICLMACDGCDGRKMRMCDCVVIVIAEC